MDGGGGVPEELRCKRSDGKQWRCGAPSMPGKTVCEKHYHQAKKRAAVSVLRRTPSTLLPARDGSADCADSSGSEGLLCHQCRRSDGARVLCCSVCERRGYCRNCVARWYEGLSLEEVRVACPACRGICSCAVCQRGEGFVKARQRKISSLEKLRRLHGLLSSMLPALRKILTEHCVELDLERIKRDIPRKRINFDEQICCDICGMPIVDYHRHCINCSTEFCLDCCQEARKSLLKGGSKNRHVTDKGREASSIKMRAGCYARDDMNVDFQHSIPMLRAKKDGSVWCPNDCCNSPLMLRRIFKTDWISKLAKNVEELVNGCKISDLGTSEKCACSSKVSPSMSREHHWPNLYQCSQRHGGGDHLYTPTTLTIERKSISHFWKHWIDGEPIIIRQAIDCSSSSDWDLKSIRTGINGTENERFREDDTTVVKAIDCLTRKEVEIELGEFTKGYFMGLTNGDGTPKMLRLKEWPASGALEEFLLLERPRLLKELPLLEFFHPKWGLLNLAAKLPHYLVQTDSRPRLHVAYGSVEELHAGDSVVDLNINISDMVYVLMHSAKADFHTQRQSGYYSSPENNTEPIPEKSSSNETAYLIDGNECCGDAGAIWDVFQRKDTDRLNEYLRCHSEELGHPSILSNQIINPLYEQAYFLHKEQKQKLKEETGLVPWTFKQCVGEAVFIPAGCPFQLRNLKSCVQLIFGFQSPESLSESMRVVQEIRYLPNDHVAKLQMLEVGKMPLYASSWAIREIQRMILEDELGAELGLEDQNLTKMVSDNVQRLKRNRLACK